MKTHTVTTYSATELKSLFPDAFERALERYRRDSDEIHWQEEIFQSLKATVEAAGLTLCGWNLGLCNRSNGIKIAFPGSYDEETAELLSGPRAMAWLENNLFGPLRIGWTTKARRELRRYGSDYYAGKVKPCPLTGVCFDEDMLDHLRKEVARGSTLKEAFEGLADVYVKLLEAEYKDQMSEEYFIESHGDDCFTADGERF